MMFGRDRANIIIVFSSPHEHRCQSCLFKGVSGKKNKNLSCEYKIFMSVWLKGKETEKFVACRGNKTEKVHRKFLQYRLFSALSLHFQ